MLHLWSQGGYSSALMLENLSLPEQRIEEAVWRESAGTKDRVSVMDFSSHLDLHEQGRTFFTSPGALTT